MDLLGIVAAVIMLSLPAEIFSKAWKIPQGRSRFQDCVDIMLSCALWGMFVKVHPEKYLVINIVQICYFALFILFNRACLLSVMNDRFNIYVIVIVELFFVYILACLVLTIHDPIEFGKTVCTTGTTFIALMRVLCKPRGTPNLENEAVLFANGVIWSVCGLISSEIFILIPNLVGALVGLVLLVQYAKRQN